MKITTEFVMDLLPCQRWPRDRVAAVLGDGLTPLELCDRDDVQICDRLWALLRPEIIPERELRLLACRWAEGALPTYEREFPGDDRPRRAIEAARRCADGTTTTAEDALIVQIALDASIAAGDAYAAAIAAGGAAAYAAGCAAYAAYVAYVAAAGAYVAYAAYAGAVQLADVRAVLERIACFGNDRTRRYRFERNRDAGTCSKSRQATRDQNRRDPHRRPDTGATCNQRGDRR